MPETKNPLVSRPKDRSLESFKRWMTEMTDHINPDHGSTLSEDQWKEKHRKFWEKADSVKK